MLYKEWIDDWLEYYEFVVDKFLCYAYSEFTIQQNTPTNLVNQTIPYISGGVNSLCLFVELICLFGDLISQNHMDLEDKIFTRKYDFAFIF